MDNTQEGYKQIQMNHNMPQVPTKIKKPINKKVMMKLSVHSNYFSFEYKQAQ